MRALSQASCRGGMPDLAHTARATARPRADSSARSTTSIDTCPAQVAAALASAAVHAPERQRPWACDPHDERVVDAIGASAVACCATVSRRRPGGSARVLAASHAYVRPVLRMEAPR